MEKTLSIANVLSKLEDLRMQRQEHFVCLSIGCDRRVIACRTVFIGTLTGVITHPREIFAAAIADHALEVIVAHNHPSGVTEPSDKDITTTKQLVAAGQILGIPLRDHIIVTQDGHFSFLDSGLL